MIINPSNLFGRFGIIAVLVGTNDLFACANMEQHLGNIGREAYDPLCRLIEANLLTIIVHHNNGAKGWPRKTE
jgi:hypothetical protein